MERGSEEKVENIRFNPDVESFLMGLYDEVYDRNLENTRKLYEVDFNALTERYYTDRRWPQVSDVATFFQNYNRYHSLIMTLYSELYHRHVFARCTQSITWEDRKNAWNNYTLLISFFIDDECSRSEGEGHPGLWLPSQWVWDMLDEFVYQFQETSRWRSNMGKSLSSDPKEVANILAIMKEGADVWKAPAVLEFLHLLVERSNIKQYMQENKEEFYRNNNDTELKHQLGYFSMICLLRLHNMLGNYYAGLQMVQDLELSPRALYWKAPACHVTLFYNLGFACMMRRRYIDATRHMSQLLIFVNKQKGYLTSQSYQQSAMHKLTDRMYLLVLICNALGSARLDESILSTIKEKYPDRYYKLQQDDEETFLDLFAKAAPKFINPAIPSYDAVDELEIFAEKGNEPHERQQNIFLKEIRFLKKITNVRSFAKLYNNIQLSKLASLMDMKSKDAEELVKSDMICVKHKSQQQQWKSGNLFSGETVSVSGELEFFLDFDILHAKSLETNTVYTDYFLKQISRCEELLGSIEKGSISQPEYSRPQSVADVHA